MDSKVGELSEKKRGAIQARKLPDLQSIKFRPSSAFYRSITQAKTGIASALVAVFFVGLGLFWWVSAQRAAAQETAQQAQLAFENQKFLASHNLWEKAFKNYKSTFDHEGQIESLLGMSQCLQRLKQFSEAIVVLQRAQKIESSEAIAERILQCNLLLGQAHLEQSEIYFQPDLYGKAFLEAKSAIAFLEEGEATDAQLAAANRMAARCSTKLKDFEGAEAFLDQAFQLEGKTKNNVTLASELGKAYAQSRQKVADSGSKSYIPTGKIDPSAIEAAAKPKPGSRPKKRRGTYGGYALNTHSSPHQRRQQRWSNVGTPSSVYRPVQRADVGEASSYPTHRKASPERDYDDSDQRARSNSSSRTSRLIMPPGFHHPVRSRVKSKSRPPSRIEVTRSYPTARRRNRDSR